MPSYNRKPPLVAAHDLPVEPPTGKNPRSLLGAFVAVVVAFAAVLGVLWLIDRGRDAPARLTTAVTRAPCPAGSAAAITCYEGAVTNPGSARIEPFCSWTSSDPDVEIEGGDLPYAYIAPRMTARTNVARVHGHSSPELHCAGLST